MIGDVEPQGLCGSGLVDAVSELVRAGLLDASGRFVTDERAAEIAPHVADRLTAIGQERVFVLHRPEPDAPPEESVYLSQRDVRELQFAKGAIATGWTLLLEELGLEQGDVQQVLLAGSFGSYLSPAAAVRIGLVPKIPVLRIVSAGNVAGEGAKMSLLSLRERAGALALLEEVDLCRALRPPRLQRPVRRPARLPRLTRPARAGSPWSPAGRSPSRAPRWSPARGWPVDVHPLPPLLHNHPERIAGEVERLADELRRATPRWWWATPTAAPTARSTRSASGAACARLAGLHCYDVYAGADRVARDVRGRSPAPTC